MAAKLNKLLKQFDGAFEKIDTGKLKCTLTSHELPARFEELKAYTENRKFLHAYGMQQIEKKYPEVFTDDGEGFVLCNLTKTRIAKTPTSIENYVKGKKFMIALHKAKEEVQKALEAEDGDEDADEDEMEVDETVVEGEDSDEEDAPVEDEEEDIEEEEEVPPPPPKAQKRKAPPQKKTPSGRAKHKKLQ
uniref:Surfeit locus protein 2 n=1 Tax=Panagrellus redivivus TaxID=6233 RepID=A0A7E4VNY3_PANRE